MDMEREIDNYVRRILQPTTPEGETWVQNNENTITPLLEPSPQPAAESYTSITDCDSRGKSVQDESMQLAGPDEQVKITLTDSAPIQQKRKKRPTTNNTRKLRSV